MKLPDIQLPSWAIATIQIIVHKDYRKEIEGDVLEKYKADSLKYGVTAAKKKLVVELVSLAKFNIIFNLNTFSIMTKRSWLLLMTVLLILIIASVSPFLPGPPNEISHNFSRFAQMIGFIGLFFIPSALIWLIIEIRNKKDQKLNRWTNGYYPAWLTLSPLFVVISIQLSRAFLDNDSFDLWPFAIIFSIVGFFIYRIQKLKNKTEYKFNPASLYIILLPIVAILCSKLAVEKAAALSREKAILRTEPLIAAIEKYKSDQDTYPEKLEDLTEKYISSMPTFKVMGIRAYQYEKSESSYQLSFEQNWHWSATETVVYMKYGHKIVKSNYENYPTQHADWRYFMVD